MDIFSGLQLNDVSGNQLEIIHGFLLRLKQLVEEVRECKEKVIKVFCQIFYICFYLLTFKNDELYSTGVMFTKCVLRVKRYKMMDDDDESLLRCPVCTIFNNRQRCHIVHFQHLPSK